MGLYDFNIISFTKDILPPFKRDKEVIAYLKGLLSEFKRSHDLFLQYYQGSLLGNVWSAGTYNSGQQVTYMPTGEMYECVVTATTTEPTTSTDWIKILDSEIGVFESQYFNDNLITLTYALNKRFQTAYADPPLLSDIYIEKIIIGTPMFTVGYTDAESSQVGFNDADSDIVTYDDTVVLNYSFVIWIPAFLSASLGSFTIASNTVRQFAQKYVSAGIIFTIDEY
jgi:hypothetical protein